jgi:hypothetical protein
MKKMLTKKLELAIQAYMERIAYLPDAFEDETLQEVVNFGVQ